MRISWLKSWKAEYAQNWNEDAIESESVIDVITKEKPWLPEQDSNLQPSGERFMLTSVGRVTSLASTVAT